MKNLANDPVLDALKARLQSQLDFWIKHQNDEGNETKNPLIPERAMTANKALPARID